MSADNWAICPKCKDAHEKAHQKKLLDAVKAYGKVTSEEYLDLVKQANVVEELQRTFREDYSLGINDSGEFYVNYTGHCKTCDFGHEYHFKKKCT